jgi:hypothetical protein
MEGKVYQGASAMDGCPVVGSYASVGQALVNQMYNPEGQPRLVLTQQNPGEQVNCRLGDASRWFVVTKRREDTTTRENCGSCHLGL